MMQIQLFREKLSTANAITAFDVINALENNQSLVFLDLSKENN